MIGFQTFLYLEVGIFHQHINTEPLHNKLNMKSSDPRDGRNKGQKYYVSFDGFET